MFEDIKVGDKVLVYVAGKKETMWAMPRSFRVLRHVEKCTSKRFVVDGKVYKKENGQSYPFGLPACKPYRADLDETKKLKKYNMKVEVIREAESALYNIEKRRNTPSRMVDKMDIDTAKRIHELSIALLNLLKQINDED